MNIVSTATSPSCVIPEVISSKCFFSEICLLMMICTAPIYVRGSLILPNIN